jgi:hypothetical protein
MTLYVPGFLFAAGVSLYLFHEFNRVRDGKNEQRRDRLNEKRQEYLDKLMEVKRREGKSELDQHGEDGEDGERLGG